ncbi:MAG: hypothetical protein AB8H79_16510 [Myxococcota bacterium]
MDDLTYFATHQLNALDKSIDALHHWLSPRQRKLARARSALRQFPGINARQAALIDHALRHPNAVYDIATHQAFHTITYPTARADLVSRGLEQQKSRRKPIFFVDDRLAEHVARRS